MKKSNRFVWYTGAMGLTPVAEGDEFNFLPDWMEDVFEGNEDHIDRKMEDAGAKLLESYGTECQEHIDVWELPAGNNAEVWLTHYSATASRFNVIVIVTSLVDFLIFQSGWLNLAASKVIQADQYFKWQHDINDNPEPLMH